MELFIIFFSLIGIASVVCLTFIMQKISEHTNNLSNLCDNLLHRIDVMIERQQQS